jgi:hypothetical protein
MCNQKEGSEKEGNIHLKHNIKSYVIRVLNFPCLTSASLIVSVSFRSLSQMPETNNHVIERKVTLASEVQSLCS